MGPATKFAPFVTTGTEITDDKDVADLLVAAFEGGANYWIGRMDVVSQGDGQFGSNDVNNDDYYPMCVLAPIRGGKLRITPDDDDKAYTLDRAAIQRGLQLMRTKYHRHWADFMTCDYDATTGDVLLQLAVLGDIVYG